MTVPSTPFPASPPTTTARRLAWMAVIAGLYVLGGRLGLSAGLVDSNITLVWPPTGIAIAALLRGGTNLWPGVALGAFLVNWWIGTPVLIALGIAVGNTLGPLLVSSALLRLDLHPDFDRRRDVGWFCLVVMIGLAIPPSLGVPCLSLGGALHGTGQPWLLWWLGDVVGALVLGPLLLTARREALRRFTDRYHVLEFVCLCGATLVIGMLIFLSSRQMAVAFLVLPLVLWSALRFGAWVSSLIVVLIAVLAAIGTASRLGPFGAPGLEAALLLTSFIVTAALLNLMLCALLAERGRAEVALREGLERLRLAIDHAHMIPGEADLRSGRLSWGGRPEALYGAEPGAIPLTLEEFFACVHPDDQPSLSGDMARRLEGTLPLSYAVEFRIVRLDGGIRWVASVGEFLRDASGQVVRTIGMNYDISERRQAEAALRESELRNRTLVEHAPEAVMVFDVELGRFSDVNPRACQLFALSAAELRASDPARLSPPLQPDGQASSSAVQVWLGRAAAGEVPRFEWTHRDAHGHDIPCEISLVRLPAAGRTLIRGTIVDISERRHARAALQTSEDRLRIAFTAAGLGAWELDLASDRITWSPDCCRMHGLEPVQAPPTSAAFYRLIHAEDRAAVQEALAHAIANGTPLQCEYRIPGADDGHRWLAAYARCQNDAQDRPLRIIGVIMDVSARHHADEARQQLEAHLFQAQKMEAIGTLAGGIAHDFNNILAAIIGNLELARGDVALGRPVQQRLDNILAASQRARDLVRQILAFSRQQDSARSVVRLEPLVHEVASLLRASLPATVTMEVRIDPASPPVRVDTSQMHQVLMNLCTNAWQALPGQRGRLMIALAPVDLDAAQVRDLPGFAPGRHLRLSVSDTGTGMDAATQARIFEPFFTTKPTGQGTGLGLAVVHGIVQAHGGAIVVASQVGTGTTFHVYLPAATAPPSARAGAAVPPRGHGEHILFVDDEPALVALGSDLLGDLGYRVTGCTSAQAALAALRGEPDDVDLVISDLTMPEMSGIDLARAMLGLRPDLPIILATGYSGALTLEQAQACGVRTLLIKPTVLEILAAAVHDGLRQRG
jgi:PAS domain S-box-containing protein